MGKIRKNIIIYSSKKYNPDRIQTLTENYIRTKDDAVFEYLLFSQLAQIVSVQLGKNYASQKRNWEDLKQETLFYLWEKRELVFKTNAEVYVRYYWLTIRRFLRELQDKKNREIITISLDRY